MSRKTERLIIILCIGWTVIVSLFCFVTVRKQNIQKENIRIAEKHKYIEQTFDVKMHRVFHDEIKELIKTHCKADASE